MPKQAADYILFHFSHHSGNEGGHDPALVGQKLLGLTALPNAWQPPYMVLISEAYDAWRASDESEQSSFVGEVSAAIFRLVKRWQREWPFGIILRSSAPSESLRDRGTFESRKLLPDFDISNIERALIAIYSHAKSVSMEESIAVIIQPRVNHLRSGHISNERRVSATQNRWIWETLEPSFSCGQFGSQRSDPPFHGEHLTTRNAKDLLSVFRSLGQWCNKLGRGRANLEWSWDGNHLWVHQLDFEEDSPDEGVDPRNFIRATLPPASSMLPKASFISEVAFQHLPIGWEKIDMLADFLIDRQNPYPKLFILEGHTFLRAFAEPKRLMNEIECATSGRAVCRTDCRDPTIRAVNLPRTDSVSPKQAVSFMKQTAESFDSRGVDFSNICFIIHQFIPSRSAAWSASEPDNQLVYVDSLWGVPDGLQYLPHDSFEYDIKRGTLSAERKRYKPVFVQETNDGLWQDVRVKNCIARYRSISMPDIREIATQTYQIAVRNNQPVQVMWFCGIPNGFGIGRNLPWYKMSWSKQRSPKENRLSPERPRLVVRNLEDVSRIESETDSKLVIALEPNVNLIRDDDKFLNRIIKVAREKNLPVELNGSALGHAYYTLIRANITTVLADVSSRSRVRGRQVFRKLVRDEIPSRILEGGEKVTLARISKSESRGALLAKLIEEVSEAREADDPDKLTTELADILEVVRALSTTTGVNWDNVLRIADEKRAARGSFEHRVVLLETTWPSGTILQEDATKRVPLMELAKVRYHMGGVEVPFTAFFAKGVDPMVSLESGDRLRLSLTFTGILLEELKEEISNVDQLSFDY